MDELMDDSLLDKIIEGVSNFLGSSDSGDAVIPDINFEMFPDFTGEEFSSQGDILDFINGNTSNISRVNVSDESIDGDFGNGKDIIFTGNSDNSQQVASLQSELNKANNDIDYYTREIRNFTDKTSATHKSNCTSALNRATKKAVEVANKIKQLKT